MNLLFLSELLYPHGGGAELATYLYAKLLSKLGFNVRVVTNLFPGEKSRSNVGTLEILRLRLLKHTTALKHQILGNLALPISTFLRNCINWADVVYIPLYWYSAIPQARVQGKPVVVHLHNYILTCPLGTLFQLSSNSTCTANPRFVCPGGCVLSHERASRRSILQTTVSMLLNSVGKGIMEWLASMSDALICVSKGQKALITKASSNRFWSKLHVAYNPLPDLSYLDFDKGDFGYFGGYVASKGFHVLYKAAKIFNKPQLLANVHTTKFGATSGTVRVGLERLGFIIHPWLTTTDYERLYRKLRCVIVPSVWDEPLPYVVTEALLRGRFVIASRTGGIPEITEGCAGVELFEAQNHEELASKMKYVQQMSNKEVTEMGLNNRENILRKFNDDTISKQFIKILNSACEKA